MQITANCLNTMVMVPQDLQVQGMQMTKSTFITLKKETSCKNTTLVFPVRETSTDTVMLEF